MNNSYLISIIVPVYNVEKYLSQCLENLIFQTYKNLEIIIVDDGSTDNSCLIYKQYASNDNRIKIIKQENMGLAEARNVGVKQAQGEYIHFMDSDDYINLDYYEKMINAAVNSNADMTCSGFSLSGKINPDLDVKFASSFIVSNIDDKIHITDIANLPSACRYLFRKNFLNSFNLVFEKGRLCEDIMFTYSAAYYSNKIAVVSNAVYFYRYGRPDSTMTDVDSKRVAKRIEDETYAKNKLSEFANKYGFEIRKHCPDKEYYVLKYKLFSKLSLFRKKVYRDKAKYYIFGGKFCVLTVNTTSHGKDK
ncbi:MAG: glycosyltransferase [Elusimicrobiota bacterium]|nr:glycosyltransferase [Elusimicrobiota bacterium]